MSIEFAKAYKNFQKFEEERSMQNAESNSERKNIGLLTPRTPRKMNSTSGTELDKVADYVQQIRKHRMKK